MKLKPSISQKIRCFSLIELLITIAIIAILVELLLPAFSKSRDQAKFVRWLAFNRQCSNDPACVLNMNFQEGSGRLTNSAKGAAFKGYEGNKFQGSLIGDCEWTEGRWPGKKKAILFPGHYSYVVISTDPSCDFGIYDDFTIVLWVCFDFPSSAGPLLTKGLFQYSAPNYFSQFYINQCKWWNADYNRCRAAFEVQTTGYGARYGDASAKGKKMSYAKHEWIMLTIRNQVKGNDKIVDFFINGEKMGRDNEEVYEETISIPSVIMIGGMDFQRFGSTAPIPDHQQYGYGFKGRVDELLIYRRALPDGEIKGHYEMGRVN
ncbi:MAG: LamG domain-containing protein [Lentisphaerae bacterium]|nr:LamG domain-containing protein [Lentisphaerota bacterium]MCP4103257.1 LamG domain-containing protein [Lentisphaerota bacterium]